MKNTMEAIKYGLETMGITPKEMFSLMESSNGYEGEEYNRWLVNEIIKIAEKDGVGYSQLLAKWFNIIQSIIEEYADVSIKKCYENKILDIVKNDKVFTIGVSSEVNPYGVAVDEIDWGSLVDLPFNFDFIDTLPDDLKTGLTEDTGVTILVKFNPKKSFKKNADIVTDAKHIGIPIRNYDSMILYRMCSMLQVLGDDCKNFKFVFITDTNFLYDKENAEVIKYFLSFFKYDGFVVASKDLYGGSFTSEEYAICECVPRGIDDREQDGFLLAKGIEVDGEVKAEGKCKRYSKGSDMLQTLFNNYNGYEDNVPLIDDEFKVVGVGKGVKGAYGYLCKRVMDRVAVLTSYPLKDSEYVAITEENLWDVIGYFGVTQAMDNSGMFTGISDIISGHTEYNNLVSNCVPIFLFDINSRFKDMGIVKNKKGVDVRLPNNLDIKSSLVVKKILDVSSVYFSYESKELMGVCKGIIDYFDETGENMEGKTFEQVRKECDNSNLNSTYLNALSRCKDYVSSLYRQIH